MINQHQLTLLDHIYMSLILLGHGKFQQLETLCLIINYALLVLRFNFNPVFIYKT